jgi:phage terminase large subunit-like protein
LDWARRQGAPDALDGAIIKHVSGGRSTLGFKSYDQGRTKWQGRRSILSGSTRSLATSTSRVLVRTNATDGMGYLTFTPLKGMSDVVYPFAQECGQL